jgi:hypothetical protein
LRIFEAFLGEEKKITLYQSPGTGTSGLKSEVLETRMTISPKKIA